MYKPTDVFLNAEDCAKIAPYIPADLLKEWEWWWVGNAPTTIWLQHLPAGHYANYGETKIPALDVGILGSIIKSFRKPTAYGNTHELYTHGVELSNVGRGKMIFEDSESELQNRRDAIIYLIDEKLVSPAEGREE